MVKNPRSRHSRPQREPATIDLQAGEVSRVTDDRKNVAEDRTEILDMEPPSGIAGHGAVEPAVSGGPGEQAMGSPPPAEPPLEAGLVPDELQESDTVLLHGEPPVEISSSEEPLPVPSEPEAPGDEVRSDHRAASDAGSSNPESEISDPDPAGFPAPSPPRPPEPPVSRQAPHSWLRSAAALVTAALIGAVLTLAGDALLREAGVLRPPSVGGEPAELAGLEADLAALRSEVEALKSAPAPGDTPPAIQALGTELAQLRTELEALKSGPPSAGIAGVEALADQLAQLRTDLDALRAAPPAGGTAGLEALAGQLAAFGKELAAVKQAVAAAAGEDAEGMAAVHARLKQVEAAVATLTSRPGASAEDLAALGQRVSALETSTKAGHDTAAALLARLAALEKGVQALTARVDAQAAQPKIALAIAAAALKSAIERGAPFQAEIETFAAVAPEAPYLQRLRSYAETGVATRADIIAETDAAADAMVAAADPADPDAGFFDRLLASAESLVAVRPIGAVEGAGAPETVARMELAVKKGDLEKALAEYATLPEAAKAAGAAFAARMQSRLEVETLVDRAIAAVMKA